MRQNLITNPPRSLTSVSGPFCDIYAILVISIKKQASFIFSRASSSINMSQELFGFLPQMVDDERSFTFQMQFYLKVLMTLTISLSMIWGTLMKCFIFYCISQEKWTEKPINVLIVLDQVIHLFYHSVISTGILLKVGANKYYILNIFYFVILNCCVFRPAFGCYAHPKAG